MKFTERMIYLAAIFTALFLGLRLSANAPENNLISVHRLQIVDDNGHPRILLSADSLGTSKIEFLSPNHMKSSVIEQFGDGNIMIQLAGAGSRPSVTLTTDFQLGGPSLTMRGKDERQTIVLGFPMGDTVTPSQSISTWGLFFPGRGPHEHFAGIGVSRNLVSNHLDGFVFPLKTTTNSE